MKESVASPNAVTVLIPTFNRVDSLRKSVESVLNETRVPLMVHIFDNASSDGTEEYAKDLQQRDPRVVYERRPQNVGSLKNFGLALETVSSSYFVPLSDDDWLLPDFLHDAYRILEDDPDAGAAIFIGEWRDEDGQLLGTFPEAPERLAFGKRQASDHFRDWVRAHYAWSAVLWRREVLSAVGAPFMTVGLPSDVDFQAQVFSAYPVHLVNRPGAVYLQHSGQSSVGYDAWQLPNWARLFARMDAAVARQQLYPAAEYRALRESMRQRFRGLWAAPLPEPVSLRRRIPLAYAARFGLDDPDVASALLGTEGLRHGAAWVRAFPRRAVRRTLRTVRRRKQDDA